MRHTFQLDARALLRARASKVLALDPSALGTTMALAASSPSAAESPGPGVALIPIEGPLEQRASDYLCGFTDGYDAIADRFTAALADRDVAAVVLQIDSPGGELAGLEEGVRRMAAAKAEAGKPVLAYVDELAASAAYWLAAALADEIVLPVAGQVGSIGTIAWYVDETAALEAEGIALHVHRDPPGKAAMHPGAPVSEVADAELQRVVSEATQRFATAVSDARGISLASIGGLNGEVVYGEAAVRAGLADRIGTLEETIAAAAEAAEERNESMARSAEEQAAATELARRVPAAHMDMSTTQLTTVAAEYLDEIDPVADLGRKIVSLAGGTTVEALAAVGAWKESHDRAEQERAEISTLLREERARCLAALVATGWETPATAWADPVNAPDIIKQGNLPEPHPDHAETPIASLRRRVETLCATPRTSPGPSPQPAGSLVLTEAQQAMCQDKGWDPQEYARQLQASMERQAKKEQAA